MLRKPEWQQPQNPNEFFQQHSGNRKKRNHSASGKQYNDTDWQQNRTFVTSLSHMLSLKNKYKEP